MKHLRCGSLQSQIGPVTVQARIVGEAVGMTAEAELIVGRVIAAVAGHQLRLFVALETRARDHVEDSVSTIAIVG